MPQTLSTLLICLLIAAGLFFSLRKLWRDKKNGKTCCGGGCAGCCGCSEEKKKREP